MFRTTVDEYKKNIVIETDDITVKGLLEYTVEDRVWSPWLKQWTTKKVKRKIYDRKLTRSGHEFFLIGIGWASYILMTFQGQMIKEDYDDIVGAIYRDSYRTQPFPELRDIQNQDVLHLLKYRRGLANLYTGYGKTMVIVVLTKYYLDIGKKVLQVCPQKKPQQELVKRMKNLYGLDISTTLGKGQVQAMITSGLLNRNDYKDENKRQDMIKELESFDVVLVDEVEYCINPAGEFIFESIRPDILLGFSGTADKKGAKLLNLRNGLSDPTVANNATLIKYFGPALVFRLPLNLDIDDIRIESAAMNYKSLRLWEVEESGNIYLEIMSKIFTNPKVCELIVKLIEKYPRLFIPINSLQDIINHWIDNYFLGRFRILLICHEGYIYYDLQGNQTNLTLQEACDKVNAGEVDVIPGTSSSFRALDMPRLDSALILSGQIAGSVIQSIGRIARSKHFNILSLDPENGGKLPVHTKGQKIREELIAEYYKYCKINKITIHENNL